MWPLGLATFENFGATMNRFLIAMMVGVLAAGCAEAIDDPEPGPDKVAASNPGQAQQFSADLPDTTIDPTKLGTGITTPKEQLTYENPGAHPGWLGERLNTDEMQKVDVERTFDAEQVQQQAQLER